jgi:GNAT superfamily N-acetyltransferase
VQDLGVDPKSQGKGIGSTLMSFAESKASEKGLPKLYIATHVLLNENISLYLHLGWEVAKRDETRVFMKKMI